MRNIAAINLRGTASAANVAPFLQPITNIDDNPALMPEYDFGDLATIEASLKGDFVMHQGGCDCATCMEGGGNPSGGGSNAPDLVPGDITSTATIEVGGSAEVSIDIAGDRDWYKVTLVAGTAYTIQTASNGSGADAFLNLRDAAGNLITSNDDGGEGLNSLITYTAPTSGTYFIDAGTYNNLSTGGFRLFVAPINIPPGDSVGDTIGTASTLAIGGTLTGRLEYFYDRDVYAVNLVAGQTYLFRTAGTSTSTSTDTYLIVRDSTGAVLLGNNDTGEARFSAIRFTATSSGTHYVDVSAGGLSSGLFNLTAFAVPTPPLFTNDQIATQLTHGYWGGQSRRWDVTAGGTLTVNITALTEAGQYLAREALGLWTDATGILFSEVTTGGQISFDDTQASAFASSVVTGGIISSSQVNVGVAWLNSYGTGIYSYSFQTYVHEIGHALGLGHGGNYNGSADYVVDSLYLNDSWATTVMSYFDQTENTHFQGQGFTRQFVGTPLVSDLIAANNLYGSPTNTRLGNTIYGYNNNSGRESYSAFGTPLTVTIVDHGGTDTLDYSIYKAAQRFNLNAETFSNVGGQTGNLTIARGTIIENAIGGLRDDIFIGNDAVNRLEGNSGADEFTGAGGSDTLIGGGGADVAIFAGNRADYTITTVGAFTTVTGLGARAGDGIDTLTEIESIRFADMVVALGGDPNNPVELGEGYIPSLSYDDGAEFEHYIPSNTFFDLDSGTVLTYTATLDDGSLLPSWLIFDAAAQLFRGTAPIAAIGTYLAIRVTASDQSSSVLTNFTLNFTQALGADITGTSGADQLFGTFRSETIYGLEGDDRIYASAGSDSMNGGDGADTVDYGASNAGVTVDLNVGTGLGGIAEGDLLVEIEHVVGSNYGDVIYGTSGDNMLYGMGGDDILNGLDGTDALYGGDGNDTLVFRDNVTAIAEGGSGRDLLRVEAGILAFSTISSIEAIELWGSTLNLTSSQVASGLARNTDVTGWGEIRINMDAPGTLFTKLFNFLENVAVYVTGSSGNDIIKLGDAVNIIDTGNGANIVQGGDMIDEITGGSGVDKIAGNLGGDYLTGGAGADVFKYRSINDSNGTFGIDTITDFTIGQDRLNFSKLDANAALAGDQAFAFIGTGDFVANGLGQIRYDSSGPNLLVQVDVDGDGQVDMDIELQGLTGATLTAGDFVL